MTDLPSGFGWLIEDTVMFHYYAGEITLEKVNEMIQYSLHVIEELDHRAYIIIDLSQTTELDNRFNKVTTAMNYAGDLFKHPNLGGVIVFGTNNRFMKFAGSIVSQLSKNDLIFVETYNTAIKTLSRLAPHLVSQLNDKPYPKSKS